MNKTLRKEIAKNYLQKKEWSIGNGQCPGCGGLKPFIFDRYTKKSHGHIKGCKLAIALDYFGIKVRYKSEDKFNEKSEFYKMLNEIDKKINYEIDTILLDTLLSAKDKK